MPLHTKGGAAQWPDYWVDEEHRELLQQLRKQNISLEPADGPVWVVILDESTSNDSTMVTSSGRTSVVLFGAFLSVWTLVFNVLLCFLLCRAARKLATAASSQTSGYPSRIFVFNFALAQLLIGAFVIPLSVATERAGVWPLGSGACRLWLVGQVVLVCVSMWALIIITVDRFVFIHQPVSYSKRTSSCWVKCVGLALPWVMGVATSVPLIIWLQQPDFVLEEVCAVSMTPTRAMTLSFSAFLAPAIFILVGTLLLSMAGIHAKMQQNYLRRNALGGSEDSDEPDLTYAYIEPPSTCVPSCCPNVNYVTYAEYRHAGSATATLVAVNVVMVALWTPFYVTNVLIPFCQGMCVDPTLWSLFIWLGYASSGISPVLWLLDPQVRQRLRSLVTCSASNSSLASKTLPGETPAFV